MEANPRGIPKAPFIDNVDTFLGAAADAEGTLLKFQEMIAKYKTMETHLLQRRAGLDSKIPEIKKTLDMVQFLITRDDSDEPITTEFELNDTLWVNAKIRAPKHVCLWLGANVMLEYETEEASKLLSEKLSMAQKTYGQIEEDLEFLREQITTMEVNFSRVHNWDVKRRRGEKKE
ncbi:Prefoldin subunit-domain-containing protein [Zopfochytrium polystomum]|nr:Prefoldin subunit-domain-containing protein [Zopfochytrium polystomum]